MSVILNALRSREDIKATHDKIKPREGFFFAPEKSSSTSRATRLSILVIILFAASTFAIVRVSIRFLAVPQTVVTQAAPLSDLKLPAPGMDSDLNAAKALFSQNRLDESLAAYEKLLKASPSDAMLLNDAGLVLLKQDRIVEAESRLKSALQADPKCSECYNNLGLLATRKGQMSEAEEYLKMAIALKKTYPDPYFNLAVLFERAGDKENAKTYFSEFLKVAPNQQAAIVLRVKEHLTKLL